MTMTNEQNYQKVNRLRNTLVCPPVKRHHFFPVVSVASMCPYNMVCVLYFLT